MSAVLIFVSIVVTFFVTAYFYVKNAFSYWKRRGVPFKEPSFPFGNFTETFSKRRSFPEEVEDIYNESNERFLGLYSSLAPTFLIRDPNLIKDIFIKDFQSFSNRGWHGNAHVDPMADNILLQKLEKWKNVRSQLSPAFTVRKLKAMFDTIVECGKKMGQHVELYADTNQSVEIHEVLACFATNVIVSVGFGIDVDCFDHPDCEFREKGSRIFEPTLKNMLRKNISIMMPELSKFLKLRFADKDVGDFMIDTVRQNLEYRESNNVSRKDFFQMLMQLRNTGKIQDDDDWTAKSSTSNKQAISLEEMAAHSFLFFIAGFETTSSAMSFFMYELAKNPAAQQKAHDEIVKILGEHDGKLTYDAVADMKYVGQCLDEALRLHPPIPVAGRKCTQNYTIPGTDVVIEEGTFVMFSSTGLQKDPKYYDEPKQYKPERYSDELKEGKSFADMPNLAFGIGPRNCLGMRMGRLNSKLAIIMLLRKFHFELTDELKNTELKLHPLTFTATPVDGIRLKVFHR